MTLCKVHGCWANAEAEIAPNPEFPALKIPLCTEHEHAVANGEPWLMDAARGGPGGTAGPAIPGYTILMGEDMPPVAHSVGLSRTTSHAPGAKITLRYETPSGLVSSEFWVSESQGHLLGEFFGAQETI